MKNSGAHGPTRAVHRKAIICLILSLAILFVSTRTMARIPDIFKGYVVGGVQRGLAAVSSFFSRSIGAVSQLRSLQRDYNALLEKMREYESRSRDFVALRDENERLKELLGLRSLPDTKKIVAHVIAKDPSNIYSSLVIDKGYVDGIKKYMPVIAYQEGVEGLVGKVLEVKASTSVLQPLYDQRFFAAARLAETRAEGMIKGHGFRDSPLNLLYIPKGEMDQLKQGDIVVTSGLDQVFPPDIMVGRVENFRLDEFSSSLIIEVWPSIDLSRVEYVFVVDRGQNE